MEPDVTITLVPGEAPEIQASLVNVRVTGENESEWIEFNLTTPKERVVVRVVSDGYFDVDRALQVVPEVDQHFFFETKLVDVRDPESGGRLVNATKSGDTVTVDMAFFIEGGDATLRLTRDVRAPVFQVGEPYDIKPYSFLLKTSTDEYALATITYWKAPDGEPIPLPTTIYALEQTFPVQGLDDDREYRYRIEFWDWAKNGAASEEFTMRTPPLVTGPPPVVLAKEPEGDFPEAAVLRFVKANYTTPVGVIDPEQHVRLFVDLTEVTHLADVTAERIRYEPDEPFAPGFHRVGLEVSNSEQGKAIVRWTFTIAGAEDTDGYGTPGPGILLILVALGVAGVLRGGRAAKR